MIITTAAAHTAIVVGIGDIYAIGRNRAVFRLVRVILIKYILLYSQPIRGYFRFRYCDANANFGTQIQYLEHRLRRRQARSAWVVYVTSWIGAGGTPSVAYSCVRRLDMREGGERETPNRSPNSAELASM